MRSISETGHTKNIANFQRLISLCMGYGVTYNPSNINLTISALETKQKEAAAAEQNARTAKVALDNVVNTRKLAFTPLKKLATRILNAVKASTVSAQTIEDIKTIHRKIQGRRSPDTVPKTNTLTAQDTSIATESTKRKISVSQQSYDLMLAHFGQLLQILGTQSLYTPNESDLQVASLNVLLQDLQKSHLAVIQATTAYSKALTARDNILYAAATGLVDLALEAKQYVRSLPNKTGPHYKQINQLQFKRQRS